MTPARGGARERGGRFYAHVRYGKSKRLELRVPYAKRQEDADARAAAMAEAATAFVKIGRRDLVRKWLRELAEAATDAQVAKVLKAIDKIVRGERQLALTGEVLFEEWARRWTSGELAEQFPDHVKAIDHSDNVSRLREYILPQVDDLPMSAFTLDHADRIMAKLPRMSPANRRHVAQIVHRLMHLAVFPGKLIAQSPIPRGWLPKVPKRRHYSCLFPLEENQFLSNETIEEAFRLFCGVLDREGMRLSELLDCEWTQWGTDCRTFLATVTKTGDPRFWAVQGDTAAAMRIWKEKNGTDEKPFAKVLALVKDRTKIAEYFRNGLKSAGVTRAELFKTTDQTGKLRAHDMRATFVTISLAQKKTDTWIRDRTAHKSTSMIDRYRRHARQFAELGCVELVDLVEALGWAHPVRLLEEPGGGAKPWGGGTLVEDPPKSLHSEGLQTVESTEGRTRTGTTGGRRILNPLAGSEGSSEGLISRRKSTSRDVARRASTTLPPPSGAPGATSSAEHEAVDVERSSSVPLGRSARVSRGAGAVRAELTDGTVLASAEAREGEPVDDLEERLRLDAKQRARGIAKALEPFASPMAINSRTGRRAT